MLWKSIFLILHIINQSDGRKLRSENPVHKENFCTWYDQCHYENNVWYNCLACKKSKVHKDETGLEILREMCPSIYGDGTKVRTCCSTDQLKNMKSQMQIPHTVSYLFAPILKSRENRKIETRLLGQTI